MTATLIGIVTVPGARPDPARPGRRPRHSSSGRRWRGYNCASRRRSTPGISILAGSSSPPLAYLLKIAGILRSVTLRAITQQLARQHLVLRHGFFSLPPRLRTPPLSPDWQPAAASIKPASAKPVRKRLLINRHAMKPHFPLAKQVLYSNRAAKMRLTGRRISRGSAQPAAHATDDDHALCQHTRGSARTWIFGCRACRPCARRRPLCAARMAAVQPGRNPRHARPCLSGPCHPPADAVSRR